MSLLQDLLAVASRLPWRLSAALAVATAIVLHVTAKVLSVPPHVTALSNMSAVVLHSFCGTLATLSQFVIPPAFAIGAIFSYVHGRRTAVRFDRTAADYALQMPRTSWSDFERVVGEAFRRRGFVVQEKGGPAPDDGVDLIAVKGGRRFLVQCKHWKTQQVGVNVVRELNGVVAALGAGGGYVVTSGTFTPEAQAFAGRCPVKLIDGKQLEALIAERPQTEVKSPVPTSTPVAKTGTIACPKCGAPMVVRVAKKGSYAGQEFLGCSHYPRCTATLPLASKPPVAAVGGQR